MTDSNYLPAGLYRNRFGSEMHVTGPIIGGLGSVRSLGGIYHAEVRDAFFGTARYMVTPQAMRDAGYVAVPPEGDES